MGIKAFHIFFIGVCTLMFVGLGAWQASEYSAGAGLGALAWSGLAFAGAAGLLIYGVGFVKKLRGIGYL